MKGIILAGGYGTRLKDCTKVTNKHLLAVYDKPMIYYPIETLVKSGIEEILIIAGEESTGDFLKLLGTGKKMNCDFTYKVQEGAGGIAAALNLAKNFVRKEPIAVILGDNYYEDLFQEDIKSFQKGAKVFLKEVKNPQRFGVAVIENNKLIKIIEKPKDPPSNLVTTGLYLYDYEVFDIIKTLKPSNRGELEITDVNNSYLKKQELDFRKLQGFWSDMGTPSSLLKTANYIKEKEENVKNY